jgi:hypothetical protein
MNLLNEEVNLKWSPEATMWIVAFFELQKDFEFFKDKKKEALERWLESEDANLFFSIVSDAFASCEYFRDAKFYKKVIRNERKIYRIERGRKRFRSQRVQECICSLG